jgi:hypothetical protein
VREIIISDEIENQISHFHYGSIITGLRLEHAFLVKWKQMLTACGIFDENNFEEGLPLAAKYPSLSNNSLIAKSK